MQFDSIGLRRRGQASDDHNFMPLVLKGGFVEDTHILDSGTTSATLEGHYEVASVANRVFMQFYIYF